MAKRLKNDASTSIAGTIHQFYVALDYCFDLVSGETLFIEKFGDVAIPGIKQLEVKKYNDDLTDLHENIWKTINNWLEKDFLPSDYKKLILLTTQDFSKSSTMKEWNEKNAEEKKIILKNIEEKYKKRKKKDSDKENLVSNVLSNSNADKLKIILEKFVISDSSPKEVEYWNIIKDTKVGDIPSTNRDDYLNSLLGFIISPETVNTNSWTITYNDFSTRRQELTKQFCTNTKIFPQIRQDVSEKEKEEKSQHLFVKKIEDISYDEVKSKAISDYIKTNQIIHEDFKKHSVPIEAYKNYEKDVVDLYTPKYKTAKRNIRTPDEIEKKSQDFYDEVTGSPIKQFFNFNDTPTYFRNGTLHNLAEDKNKDIKWRLEEEGKDE